MTATTLAPTLAAAIRNLIDARVYVSAEATDGACTGEIRTRRWRYRWSWSGAPDDALAARVVAHWTETASLEQSRGHHDDGPYAWSYSPVLAKAKRAGMSEYAT